MLKCIDRLLLFAAESKNMAIVSVNLQREGRSRALTYAELQLCIVMNFLV